MAVKISLTKRRVALILATAISLVVWIVFIVSDQTTLLASGIKDNKSGDVTLLENVKNILNKAQRILPNIVDTSWFQNTTFESNEQTVNFDELKVLGDVYELGFEVPLTNVCPQNGSLVHVVIVVTSAPQHVTLRNAIRHTWGHFDRYNDVIVVFHVGSQSDPEITRQLAEENAIYNDVIVNKNIDTYRNLTLKTMSLFEWFVQYCSQASFLLKTDDDMFINVPRLLSFISQRLDHRNVIFGMLAVKWKPVRSTDSKYYLSKEEFSPKVFPNFVTGPAYLMTSDVPKALYEAALNMTYMPLEDVFFTGIVAQQLNIGRVSALDFTNVALKKYDKCAVHKAIAFHMVPVHDQFMCWGELMNKSPSC